MFSGPRAYLWISCGDKLFSRNDVVWKASRYSERNECWPPANHSRLTDLPRDWQLSCKKKASPQGRFWTPQSSRTTRRAVFGISMPMEWHDSVSHSRRLACSQCIVHVQKASSGWWYWNMPYGLRQELSRLDFPEPMTTSNGVIDQTSSRHAFGTAPVRKRRYICL